MKPHSISTTLFFGATLSIVVLISCHLRKENNSKDVDTALENFKEVVRKHWNYNYERGYVITNEVFYDLSGWIDKYSEELKKLDTTDVQNLFGIPRKKIKVRNEDHYYYFTQKECIPFEKNVDCSYYSFRFKANGQCYSVVRAIKISNHH